MKMILRPDLRCPKSCDAAVIELRYENQPSQTQPSEFRCKVHGPLLPPVAPLARLINRHEATK